jgi:hypothetical protein
MCTAAPTLVLSADGRRPLLPLLILFEFLFCFAFPFFFLLLPPSRHVYLLPHDFATGVLI